MLSEIESACAPDEISESNIAIELDEPIAIVTDWPEFDCDKQISDLVK